MDVTVTVTVTVASVAGTVDVANISVTGRAEEGADVVAVEGAVQIDGFPGRVAIGPLSPICSS